VRPRRAGIVAFKSKPVYLSRRGGAVVTSALASLLLLAAAPTEGKLQTFNVDPVPRQAVVYANTKQPPADGAPLVFVFHGRGGQAKRAAARFRLQEHWPESVVVYMQGLPGAAGVKDPAGKQPGWQSAPGEQRDRDVKFFDAALAQLQKQHKTDADRVYLLGHSNGARFANVLWQMRGDKLAALCSAAAQGGRLIRDCKPKSIFMIMGEKDTIAPFNWQRRSIDLARQVLGADPTKGETEGLARTEPGKDNTELVTYIHPGGHEFPDEAVPLVVEFFQRHKRK
jgi:polyhydroxybutyrate depolymerase